MKIAFVSEHNCARVTKQATVLKDLGHEVYLFTILQNVRMYDSFEHVVIWKDHENFDSIIKHYAPHIDIFQVHNEPTWHTTRIRELVPDAKIIQDFHDMQYWRMGKENKVHRTKEDIHWFDEDLSIKFSDGFVVPSLRAQKFLKERTNKPVVFIPSACPEKWNYSGLRHFNGGLVSQGGHTVFNKKDRTLGAWRDYTEIFEALVDHVEVFVYAPNFTARADDPDMNHYENIGVTAGKANYFELLPLIASHTWNLVGNWQTEPSPVWEFALPNKFWDAVAAGTPSVVINCPEAAKIVKKYDIGIVIDEPRQLVKRWNEHQKKRENLLKVRGKLTMEYYIGNLTRLYQKIGESK